MKLRMARQTDITWSLQHRVGPESGDPLRPAKSAALAIALNQMTATRYARQKAPRLRSP
jgi:hypothetical protein